MTAYGRKQTVGQLSFRVAASKTNEPSRGQYAVY
jgi:hypothetical protein